MMMDFKSLKVGDTIPLEDTTKIIGPDLAEPEWYIFLTAPQKEKATAAWLKQNGVTEAWYPVEERWRNIRRGQRKRIKYEAPTAPRYLFALFSQKPNWHVLKIRSQGKIAGVVTDRGAPLAVTEDVLLNMKEVPERIAVIKKREEEKRRLNPGDKADVTSGPLCGWTVDVTRIHAGIAYFIAPLLGDREVAIEVEKLSKVLGEGRQ